jgi:MOSC domain-containing protein YiiM
MKTSALSPAFPRVLAVSISAGGIPKLPHRSVWAARDGLRGDGRNHAKHIRPDRAVSLWDVEILEQLVAEGFPLIPGAAGENLTVAGLHVQRMAPGTLLQIGNAILKLEQPRKPCYVLDAIDPRLKEVIVGRCGYMASVVREGIIAPGMIIVVPQASVAGAERSDAPAHLEFGRGVASSPTTTLVSI